MGLGWWVGEMAGGQKGKLRDDTIGSRVLRCAIRRRCFLFKNADSLFLSSSFATCQLCLARLS